MVHEKCVVQSMHGGWSGTPPYFPYWNIMRGEGRGFLIPLHLNIPLLAIFLVKGDGVLKDGLKPICPKFWAIMRPW
jgi:hypothetical protein